MSTNDLRKAPAGASESDSGDAKGLPGWTDDISLEEVRALYVKKGYYGFSSVFARCDAAGGMQPSLTIAPFFIGYLWFFYRKMYLEGLLFMGGAFLAVVIISVFITSHEAAQMAAMGINIGLLLAMMIYGKALYWKAVDRKIDKAMNMFPHEPQKALEWLEQAGGTNVWIVVIFITVVFLFAMMLMGSGMHMEHM